MINDFHPHDLWHVWHDGGCVLIPLFLLALFIGYQVCEMLIYFARTDCRDAENEKWNEWIRRPDRARVKPVKSSVIRRPARKAPGRFGNDFRGAFARLSRLNQRIVMLGVAVAAAPLLGLLGTVLGCWKPLK